MLRLIAIAVLALTAASARADMGPPGLKRPAITHRISTRNDLADRVVVVLRHIERKSAEIVSLSVDHPIEITGERRQQIDLFIIPRELAAKYPTPLELTAAAPQIPGTITLKLEFDENVPEWYGTEFTIDYRVDRSADGGISIVRTTWRPAKQCCVAAIAIPVGILLGGLWLIRRWRRRRAARFPDPQ